GENFSLVVNVAQKVIQRGDALNQSKLDSGPFRAGNDARKQVMREDPLSALFAAIDSEGDALMEERQIGRLLAVAQLIGGQTKKLIVECLVMRVRHPCA